MVPIQEIGGPQPGKSGGSELRKSDGTQPRKSGGTHHRKSRISVTIAPEDRDLHLLDKLRAELPGVLRWAVEGCLAWQRDGLQAPAAVLAAVSTYRDEADTLGRFIAENCTVRTLGQVEASAFQRAYAEFCRDAGERSQPSKDLPAELERRGFRHHRTTAARLYLGLELNAEDSWHDRT